MTRRSAAEAVDAGPGVRERLVVVLIENPVVITPPTMLPQGKRRQERPAAPWRSMRAREPRAGARRSPVESRRAPSASSPGLRERCSACRYRTRTTLPLVDRPPSDSTRKKYAPPGRFREGAHVSVWDPRDRGPS